MGSHTLDIPQADVFLIERNPWVNSKLIGVVEVLSNWSAAKRVKTGVGPPIAAMAEPGPSNTCFCSCFCISSIWARSVSKTTGAKNYISNNHNYDSLSPYKMKRQPITTNLQTCKVLHFWYFGIGNSRGLNRRTNNSQIYYEEPFACISVFYKQRHKVTEPVKVQDNTTCTDEIDLRMLDISHYNYFSRYLYFRYYQCYDSYKCGMNSLPPLDEVVAITLFALVKWASNNLAPQFAFLRGPQQFSASSGRSLHDVHECEGVAVNWKKTTSEEMIKWIQLVKLKLPQIFLLHMKVNVNDKKVVSCTNFSDPHNVTSQSGGAYMYSLPQSTPKIYIYYNLVGCKFREEE
uniref:Uncharacterized protein n=1 Tax=Glossina austeni TaxID=7395 RepID=A0A1A9UK37_GLOAU